MDANDFVKLHKAEGNSAEVMAINKLVEADKKSVSENAAALRLHRSEAGQVALKCPKCGTESVVDAKNKSAKCGAQAGVQTAKCEDGSKHNIPAPCGAALG